MGTRIRSPKALLRVAYEPESILLCLAALWFAYKFGDGSGHDAYWDVFTEDAFFILVAAVALRLNRLWSYVAAVLVCVFVLYVLYGRWVGNWEFVAAHYEHSVLQIVFGVAILTCAVVCLAYKKGSHRPLP